jgi:hypothetical protein
MNSLKRFRFALLATLSLAAATLPMACSDSGVAGLNDGTVGKLVVRLTDAPFLKDSLASVDVFVVRVDGRLGSTDDAGADADLDNGTAAGWHTLAAPNASYNLLALQNGASATLGSATLTPGTYNGFRFIIDPSKSSITLKNGKKLTNTSSPSVTFPSAAKSGIKIELSAPVTIVGGATTTLLVDFDVNDSFVMRGNSIDQNGLLFKPVIRGTITDAATVNATIRLANATGSALDLLQGTNVLSGSGNLAFGASSACSAVNATTPGLTIRQTGTTTALPGFTPTLEVGKSYTVIAYPNATNVVQFSTLSNTFTPTTGQAGLRVFNATTLATGFDVFVTAPAATLTTPTVANVLSGASSAFVSVPAGGSQIRLTAVGTTTPVLLDFGTQTFAAGQNVTLVIAPPAAGSTTPRAFLVIGC